MDSYKKKNRRSIVENRELFTFLQNQYSDEKRLLRGPVIENQPDQAVVVQDFDDAQQEK